MLPRSKISKEEKIARLVAQMPVLDPNRDDGAFSSLATGDVFTWLKLLGVKELDPKLQAITSPQERRQEAVKKLRLALWDVQRLDLLFPGYVYSESPNFRLSRLPSWPNWKDEHPELRNSSIGPKKMDGYADARRLDSYVMRHFNLMAFTQIENARGVPMNPPKDIKGAWIGTKKIMSHATLDITREGGKDTPFVSYFSLDKGPGTSMLIMEILDVKQVSWPEPGGKFLQQLKTHQQLKYGDSADGPLNPMTQTPKIPIVVVRYSYLEGRPKDGSQFTLHLESRLKEILPPGTSAAKVRENLEYRLQCGEEMAEEHIRMFARLLSHNSELVDRDWSSELQGHWFLSKEVEKETRISFFVPCPRLRFKAIEEIETGKVERVTKCNACGKDATKLMCSSCKAVCYCTAECSKNNWKTHKAICKISKTLVNDPSSLPSDKLYVPLRAIVDFVVDYGFAHDQEAVKMGSGAPVNDCPRNEYGDERFVCRALLPREGKGMWDPHQQKTVFYDGGGGSVFVCDRRRSLSVRFGPIENCKAKEHGLGSTPFHGEGYRKFAQLVARRGAMGQLLYVWTKRVGDCLEIDLQDLPDQDKCRWE